jgi:ATP-dependent RNA helicase DeaD
MEIITMPNEADTKPKSKTAKAKGSAAKTKNAAKPEEKKLKRKDKRAAESAAATTAATPPAPARKKAAAKTTAKASPASPEENTTSTSDATGETSEIAPAETTAEAVDVAAEPGFDQLGLSEPIARAVAALGFEAPTPIQARAIPLLLAGRDLIGQAQTGTGKTAAFALPIIEKMDVSRRETQALVLAPTRELAVQVAGGIHALAKNTGLQVVPVYGGQPIDRSSAP